MPELTGRSGVSGLPAAPLTAELAQFALSVRSEDLPSDVVQAARRSLLDHAGVAAAGTVHAAFQATAAMLRRTGSAGPCQLYGSALATDAVNAAMANGLAAHVYDWDDTLLPARVHLGATLFPPLFAVAALTSAGLQDVLTAFTVGFEIQARISRAIYPATHVRHWHSTAVVAPAGVAAACGRLLGLDYIGMAHAMGLAANAASGLMSSFGTMSKSLNVGRAGAAGLQSALLAQLGVRSHPDTLGAGGYLHAFDDAPRFAAIQMRLGQDWAVLQNGFKPYPCGFVAHPSIDAVRSLRALAGDGAALAALDLSVAPEAVQLMGNAVPKTELDAKFSLAFVAAVAWSKGDVTPASFEGEAITDPAVRMVMDRTVVRAEPGRPQVSARAVASLADGTRHEATVDAARGTPERPFTDADLLDKFHAARRSAGLDDGHSLASVILGGEDLPAARLPGLIAGAG